MEFMSGIILHTGAYNGYYPFAEAIRAQLTTENKNWIALLPVNRAVRYFKRQLTDWAAPRALLEPPVFTFEEFALDFYRRQPHVPRLLPQDTLYFLIEEILKEESAQFQFFPKNAVENKRLVARIARVVEELRRFGYSGATFEKQQTDDSHLAPERKTDLTRILHALDAKLQTLYIDRGQAINWAVRAMTAESLRRVYPELQNIFISGYGIFTPAMFNCVAQLAPHIQIDIHLNFVPGNEALFAHIAPLRARLLHMGAVETPDKTPVDSQSLYLFSGHSFGEAPREEPPAWLIRAGDAEAEVNALADIIRQKHEQEQLPWHRMGITFPDMETYAPLIRRVFGQRGIPFNLSTGYALDKSPLAATIMNMLDIIAQGFPADETLSLMQSPFMESGLKGNVRAFFKQLTERRITHLEKGWEKRLPATEDDLGEIIQNIRDFLKPFYAFGLQARTADQWQRDLRRLLADSGVLGWYKRVNRSLTGREAQEREFRAYNRFMKLLEPFFWSLKNILKSGEITYKDLTARLKQSLSQATYNLTEWPDAGVQIMPRLEILAVECPVLFLGGLVEGTFPRAHVSDIFFNDPVREQLGLTASEELLDQDRFLFYQLIQSPRRALYLSYPAYSGESALVPSNFIDELKRHRKLTEITPDDNSLPEKNLAEQLALSLQARNWEEAYEHSRRALSASGLPGASLVELLRRIRVTANRQGRHIPFGPYEGILSYDARIKTPPPDVWSITLLEQYAACPMQYWLEHILKLEDWPEFIEGINALEKGTALHEILQQFYWEFSRKSKENRDIAQLKIRLKKIARDVFESLPVSGFLWELEKERYLGVPGEPPRPGILEVFLEKDVEILEDRKMTPRYLEWSFGMPLSDHNDIHSTEEPLELQLGAHTIRIRGKIDRVDSNDTGDLCFYDYKTGYVPPRMAMLHAIRDGYGFQLPVYWLALNRLLPGQNNLLAAIKQLRSIIDTKEIAVLGRVEDSAALHVHKRDLLPSKNFCDATETPITLDQLLENNTSHIFIRHRSFAEGIFRHSAQPEKEFCKSFCTFKRMCQKHPDKQKYNAEDGA